MMPALGDKQRSMAESPKSDRVVAIGSGARSVMPSRQDHDVLYRRSDGTNRGSAGAMLNRAELMLCMTVNGG